MVPRWGIFGPCEVAANHCYIVQWCAILCKSKCCWHLPTRYRIWDHTGPVLGSWYKIGEVLASGNPCPSAQSCRKLPVWHLQSLHTSTPFILQQPLQFLAIILAIQKGSASKFDWARARWGDFLTLTQDACLHWLSPAQLKSQTTCQDWNIWTDTSDQLSLGMPCISGIG